ncbi:hypothetical protein SNF32_17160 [Enterococcus mundtii]|nr:hypothetical protein [Enterococcus mundtii]
MVEKNVTNVPGPQDYIEKESSGNFEIKIHVNVKANGKVNVVTAYPFIN